MRIKRLIFFAALLLTVASGAWAEAVPQVIWCSSNHTLYFTYAELVTPGSTYRGQSVDRVYSGNDLNYGKWTDNSDILGNCTTVVFESSFSSARPTKCTYWFLSLGSLTNIQGIENLNTSEVTDMGSMFANCVELTSLDLSHFNTAKVTAMDSMFKNCTGLTTLDLSSFDTSNVETMSEMFSGCSALTTLTVATGWTKISSRSNRFKNCSPSTMNLVMDNDKSSQSLLEEFSDLISGKAVNVTLRNRTLYKDGNWNTLCLPFGLSLTGSPLENATVKTLTSTAFGNGTLTLNFGEDVTSIEAGKPYIVKWATPQGTNITNPEFHGVTIDNTPYKVEKDYVDFVGSFDPVNISGEDRTMLYVGAGNKLYYPNAEMTIGSCRAYFRLKGIEVGDPAVSAIQMNFNDNEATSLSEKGIVFATPHSDPSEATAAEWYSLDGRKFSDRAECGVAISGRPMQKGICINHGVKRVIK